MDTPLLITMLSWFTCSLFICRIVGGVPDVGGTTAVDKEMHPHLCLDAERSALLEFKQSFSSTTYYASDPLYKMNSWKAGGDCCFDWDGVECDHVTGHVIVLDLNRNDIDGSISGNSTLFQLFHLQKLDLSYNSLQGQIPSSIFHLSNLSSLDLTFNILELHRPSLKDLVHNFTKLEHLYLDNVNMTGSALPDSLSNYSRLKSLHLSWCGLSGEIPSGILRLPKLRILDLSANPSLNGHFPEFDGSSSLEELSIGSCNFTNLSPLGKLPSMYFKSWKSMEFLDADATMGYMGNELEESGYYLHSELGHYEYSIRINNKGMDRIYSKIPTIFRAIDFSHNQFEGKIPTSVAKLKGLQLLSLGHNNLTGTIPSWLGDLHQLESLDLSHNKLSGKIPQELSQLSFLSFFNVSYNNLSGIIPYGGHSDTFDSSSYEGNPGLVAYHPTQPPTLTSKSGGEEEEDDDDDEPVFDRIEWMVILIGCGSGLVVGVVLGNELVVRKPLWFLKLLGRWL